MGPPATTVTPVCAEVRDQVLIHTDSWFLHVLVAAAAPGMSTSGPLSGPWPLALRRCVCVCPLPLQAEATCSQVTSRKLSALPHLLHGPRMWIRRTQLRLEGTLHPPPRPGGGLQMEWFVCEKLLLYFPERKSGSC